METLSFETVINATKEQIWNVLFGEETYTLWTKHFSEGSVMKTDWKVGGKTYFTNKHGEGMVATIDSIEKPDSVTFKHLGMVDKDGNEDTESKEVKEWSGNFEKYILIDLDGKTKLHAEVQVYKEYHDMMTEGFEKGLEIVKNLAEQKTVDL